MSTHERNCITWKRWRSSSVPSHAQEEAEEVNIGRWVVWVDSFHIASASLGNLPKSSTNKMRKGCGGRARLARSGMDGEKLHSHSYRSVSPCPSSHARPLIAQSHGCIKALGTAGQHWAWVTRSFQGSPRTACSRHYLCSCRVVNSETPAIFFFKIKKQH